MLFERAALSKRTKALVAAGIATLRDGQMSPDLEEPLWPHPFDCSKTRGERNGSVRYGVEAQDDIDSQRATLIKKIESQLKQSHRVEPLFTVRWRLV